GLTVTGDRQVREDCRCKRTVGGVHISIDWARADQIDGDLTRTEFARKTTGKALHGRFGSRINCNTRKWYRKTRIAAYGDDPAAIRDVFQCSLGDHENSAHIDVQLQI